MIGTQSPNSTPPQLYSPPHPLQPSQKKGKGVYYYYGAETKTMCLAYQCVCMYVICAATFSTPFVR